jgi:hypothetical protein
MDKVMTKANGDLEEFFFQLIKDDEGEENNA